ncbi:hypothetical protein E6C70_12425 [Glaciibacter flavus]|uniref:Uncharacterized protein n=1 Tax=Orlajensenia flava TaxID=2565934 RepID=A0A4S4FS72_9MICO|nr:hypothetical protein [Glaciibacter flavus]THG32555.1 hypothetical protein E6C70_12425 [Glaciibacter flavus]
MSNWIGTWDVEQTSIVGTFVMTMTVAEKDGGIDVAFDSPQVVATVSDIASDEDNLTMTINLTKPLKGKADAALTLGGADSFVGTGKMKFLPASKFSGVRRA